jgi:hypothetical protein
MKQKLLSFCEKFTNFFFSSFQPVLDAPFYYPGNNATGLVAEGGRLYRDFSLAFSLIHQVRQDDPKEIGFQEILFRLREGNANSADLQMLNTRNAEMMDEETLASFANSITFVGTNSEADKANR